MGDGNGLGDVLCVHELHEGAVALRVVHDAEDHALGGQAAELRELAAHCCEFLVHGVDVEGLRAGVEDALVALLGAHSPIPVTYAGGVRDMADVERVARLGRGRVDVSVGSALDIFGGDLSFDALVRWSQRGGAGEGAGAGAGEAAR